MEKNRNEKRRIIVFIREIVDLELVEPKFRENEDRNETEALLDDLKKILKRSVDRKDFFSYRVRRKTFQVKSDGFVVARPNGHRFADSSNFVKKRFVSVLPRLLSYRLSDYVQSRSDHPALLTTG